MNIVFFPLSLDLSFVANQVREACGFHKYIEWPLAKDADFVRLALGSIRLQKPSRLILGDATPRTPLAHAAAEIIRSEPFPCPIIGITSAPMASFVHVPLQKDQDQQNYINRPNFEKILLHPPMPQTTPVQLGIRTAPAAVRNGTRFPAPAQEEVVSAVTSPIININLSYGDDIGDFSLREETRPVLYFKGYEFMQGVPAITLALFLKAKGARLHYGAIEQAHRRFSIRKNMANFIPDLRGVLPKMIKKFGNSNRTYLDHNYIETVPKEGYFMTVDNIEKLIEALDRLAPQRAHAPFSVPNLK